MLSFLWSLVEVVVWSIWQVILVLFALGVYRGYSKKKDSEDEHSDN